MEPQKATHPRVKPIITEVEQRTQDWYKIRLGKVTGSRAKDTMAFYKQTKAQALNGDPPTEMTVRKNYREGLVAERLTGQPADPEPYVTYDMKWGMVNEDIAKTLYQFEKSTIVEPGPFMQHPELMAGVSPDGLVIDRTTGELGLVEIKCLRSANHLFKIMETQEVPQEYIPQIMMQLWISGRAWCDFVGFDSRLPEGLKIFIARVDYDEEYIHGKLEPAIRRFLDECSAKEKFFRMKIREQS